MIKHLTDLAVFGGVPAFEMPLHVGLPHVPNRQRFFEYVGRALDSKRLTNDGELVHAFEQRLGDWLGAKNIVATANGTVALEMVCRALGLTGEVIVPSFTFVATAHALSWIGLTPVFCEIDPATHNLDARHVEGLISPRTSGILGVHVWGRPCETSRLQALANRHGLRLIFDAAHAFACSSGGQMVGSFGDAEVFSFHATKLVQSAEGGAITTTSDSLAEQLRLIRNFGFADYDDVQTLGTNGKMSELAAAMGLTTLSDLDATIAANRSNYGRYLERLHGLPGVSLVRFDESEAGNYQYVVLEVESELFGLTRDELQQLLWAENVLARRYFYPGCHLMAPYAESGKRLPLTESLCSRVLCLPTGPSVGVREVESICHIIRLAASESKAVSAAVARQASGRR